MKFIPHIGRRAYSPHVRGARITDKDFVPFVEHLGLRAVSS
jgi:hypothetical protein